MSIFKILQTLSKHKNVNAVKKRLCGKLIGSGVHRDVYECKFNNKYVVKIERNPSSGDFANVMEWRNYINNKEWEYLAEWLAPCIAINETGQVLIQRKTLPIPRGQWPKEIPSIFTDTKKPNWGWLNGHAVCHDYSFFPVYIIKLGGKKYKRPKWFTY